MEIPIVVAAYNRPESLRRILNSLGTSYYPFPVQLYISIDGGGDDKTIEIARDFNWMFGPKEVICHNENMGLRNHILFCGSLALRHDAIIVLEDDLYVSPGFYDYTLQSYDFFQSDARIGGISLYSHSLNETAQLPFLPVMDGSDVFFMQVPSSWGQCWTREQWSGFQNWYGKNGRRTLTIEDGVPQNVANWPDTSWKKYWFQYLIETGKYFVYPRYSLTTNFGDPGVHFHKKLTFQQVPILLAKRNFFMNHFNDSFARYDAFCEILPEIVNHFVPALAQYSYTVDLYGVKSEQQIKTKYILTSKKCSKILFSFGREFKPVEYNIFREIPGEKFSFALSRNCDTTVQRVHVSEQELYYFYNLRDYQINLKVFIQKEKDHTAKELMVLLFKKVKSSIKTVSRTHSSLF
jgi:hypothetical protein